MHWFLDVISVSPFLAISTLNYRSLRLTGSRASATLAQRQRPAFRAP
jgi:hypothetical protein